MAKTAKKVSKKFNIPLTSSFHTDAPAYSEFYVKKILNYFPQLFSNFMIRKLNIHKKVKYNQEQKIFDYFKSCEKIMINSSLPLTDYKKKINPKQIILLERGIDKKIFKKKKSRQKKIF